MTKSNKEIVLEVLKRAFIDRDPTVVEQYFGVSYNSDPYRPHVRTRHGRC